jgi:hypothetical protein
MPPPPLYLYYSLFWSNYKFFSKKWKQKLGIGTKTWKYTANFLQFH